MDEYISRKDALLHSEIIRVYSKDYGNIDVVPVEYLADIPSADVQPLSVVAERIKKRLYQTAFNTTEEKARDAIVDMAKRIDIWIDELKVGDVND